MSKLTNVTINSITMARGSISIPMFMPANHGHDCWTTLSGYISRKIPSEMINAPAIAAIGIYAPPDGSFFPMKSVSTNAITGNNTINAA
ncbi:Uncharacterised protein [uncultured archaeon]|nr:Uncharacterised protein [uncultured archaeon]